MYKTLLLLFLTALNLISCTQDYGTVGVGHELYTAQMPNDTRNISSYFSQLCAQSRLVTGYSSVTCSDYSEIVQSGFNDIDQRCDRYLTWIDIKRAEGAQVKSGLLSVAATAMTVLTIARTNTETLAYVAAALGLTNSLYDAYSNSLLIGLESSLIKKIVYQRRLEYRKQFSGIKYQRTPEMVFALRGYLRICTPQTISLDANTYALSVASGAKAPSIHESVKNEFDAIAEGQAPVTPNTQGNLHVKRNPVTCEQCEGLFPKGTGFANADVKTIQSALCLKDDGKAGPGTLAAVRNYRQTVGRDRVGPVSETEYDEIIETGCKPDDIEQGFRNYFEAVTYRGISAKLTQLITNLNKIQPSPELPAGATLNSPQLRTKIASMRAKFGLSTGDAQRDTYMSKDLERKVNQAARAASSTSQGG
ncbi:MAG: hypothetical protein AAGD15_07615 [Agrobacterium cavarae]|uniref:hypothetical protein n=1 Tax=Agrobacterium cavarae TaxID=2528239 RepID=UPI0031ACA089